MAIVKFEQDPQSPQGAGFFTDDTGYRSPLLFNPALAASVGGGVPMPKLNAPGGGPDLRTASASEFDVAANPALATSASPTAPPTASDVSGPWTPGTPFTNAPGFKPVPVVGGPTPPIGGGAEPKAPPAQQAQAAAALQGLVADKGPATSPQDVVSAYQAELGRGTPGTSSSSKTTQQGLRLDPEEVAAQQRAVHEGQAAQLEGQTKVIEAQTGLVQAAADHKAELEAQAARENDVKAAADQRAQQLRGESDQLAQAAAQKKIEPYRLFTGEHAWAGALATIGQALGAYAATIAKTPNFAQQAYERAVDMDVAAQRDEAEAARGRAQNAYQKFRDAGLDAREAGAALKQTLGSVYASTLQGYEGVKMTAEAQKNLGDMKAAAAQGNYKAWIELQQATRDRVSTTVSATGGTPGRKATVLDASIAAQKAGAITKDEAREVRGQGPEASESAVGRTAAEQKIKGSSDALLDATNTLLPKMGATRDPKTGEWETSAGDIIGSHVPTSTAKHARTELINMLAPDLATIRKGGSAAPSKEEIADVREELSTSSPEQFNMAINLAVKRAESVKHQKILHSKRQVSGGDEEEEP